VSGGGTSAKDKFPEFSVDVFTQVAEVVEDFLLRFLGVLELHLRELQELSLDCVVDNSPRDLSIRLSSLVDDSLGVFEESHYAFHHPECLVQGTVVVILGESILLQEVLSDHLCHLKDSLLVFRE